MKTPKATHRLLTALMVCALAAPFIAIDAFAQEPPRRGDGGASRHDLRDAVRVVARFLDMNEDQVHAWMEIFRQRGEAIHPLTEQLRMTEQRLHQLLESDAPDPTAVGELVLMQRRLRFEIRRIHGETADQLVGVLDETQLDAVAEVNEAARICPVVPAFRALGLIQGEGGVRP